MIILDTNVVSEPLKPNPDPAVLAWLNAQVPDTLYLTSISVAELFTGVAMLPDGRKRAVLQQALNERVLPLFAGRVLSFDAESAQAFATVNVSARSNGHPISFADAAIAAIALAHDCLLATRNLADFKGTTIGLINP